MAKAPAPGTVKTRLCPPLSPVMAALLYECFVQDTLGKARSLPDAELVISFSPADARAAFKSIAPDAGCYLPQDGRDIGERMCRCFDRLCGPDSAVVLIGADLPTLPVDHLHQAFDALEAGRADVVFGPAFDGGYYLIGMTSPHHELFREIPWSTDQVLSRSIERTNALGLSRHLLPQWYDIDTPDDLARLKSELTPSGSAELAPSTFAFLRTLTRLGVL